MNINQPEIPSEAEQTDPARINPFHSVRNFVRTNLLGTITATIAGSLMLTGVSTYNIWNIYNSFQSTVTRQFELQKTSGDFLYVDEYFTMSAKMLVTTGDFQWETRYKKMIPKNDVLFKQIKELLPPDLWKQYEANGNASGLRLLNMENKALALMHQGKQKEAAAVLFGEDYSKDKKIFSDGNNLILAKVDLLIAQELQNYQQQLLISIVFAGTTLPLLIGGWILVLSAVRDYIRERQAAQLSLTSSQTDLLQLNQQLAGEAEFRLQQEQQIRSESELLQVDIAHILDIVSSIEKGDLTIQAQVNDRATGLVSDTLNRTIESLARIVSAVVETTHTVTTDASQLEHVALDTAQQAQSQTVEVQAVQSLLDRVNTLITKSLEYGVATETAVHSAISALTTGQQAIEDTIGGMDTLRAGTDQIVKRTELLTEFVDLAAQFSKDQKRVASLTRVLALNASTLSARAVKEQNPDQFASLAKEFETIARQVNDLATDTNLSLVSLQQRTDRIQTVTSGLSQDITDINRLVQKFTIEIGKSGQAFSSIQSTIAHTSELDQKVNESNQNIVQAVRDTLTAIQSIAAVAQLTEAKATITREQVQSMGDLSRRLLQMVEFFQLNTPTSIPQIATEPEPNGNPASSQLVSV
jgi:methyl-accepting chemotaxis protein PixJ